MTPCVVTDGEICYSDDGHCVGCGRVKSEITPDATPSKEAKHTETFSQFFSRYNEKFQLGLNDLSSEGVRTRMYKAVELYVGELAQEVEDLRKELGLSKAVLGKERLEWASTYTERDQLRERNETLKAENDSLRLALSDKTEELNEVKSSRAVTGERCIELDDENHRLRESLSGKTQYDQVEVERERLRKIVEAMITGYRPFPDNDRGVEERNAIRRDVCEWFLELLSHPQ